MAFGDQLQALRRDYGLTQEQFAEQLQVSRQAVSRWESGRSYPELEKILYICNRYGISMNELFAAEAPFAGEAAQTVPETAVTSLPRRSLHDSMGIFLANLSPRNKWLAAGVLVGVALLELLIGAFLKGGNADMETTTIIWVAAIVIFGVVEAMTAGLTSIWFVLGSVAGLVAAVCGGAIWLQVVLFFVVSIAALVATRPLVRRMSRHDTTATNADRVLGAAARVTEEINNTLPTGEVYVDGKTWSARSESGEVIPVGVTVHITRMEGVKLYVEKRA